MCVCAQLGSACGCVCGVTGWTDWAGWAGGDIVVGGGVFWCLAGCVDGMA